MNIAELDCGEVNYRAIYFAQFIANLPEIGSIVQERLSGMEDYFHLFVDLDDSIRDGIVENFRVLDQMYRIDYLKRDYSSCQHCDEKVNAGSVYIESPTIDYAIEISNRDLHQMGCMGVVPNHFNLEVVIDLVVDHQWSAYEKQDKPLPNPRVYV